MADDDADADAQDRLASHHCTQPKLPGDADKRDNEASRAHRYDSADDFNTADTTYANCIRAYVDTQSEPSKKHISAANAAVKELNDFNAQLNESR